MPKINRFEEIECWRKARELTRSIYSISLEGRFSKDFALRDQLRRAAISILSNIAEGFERDGNKEFVQFLSIAKGSCGETRAQLYVALDQEYISEAQFRSISESDRNKPNVVRSNQIPKTVRVGRQKIYLVSELHFGI
jgi:four helix bundle protein